MLATLYTLNYKLLSAFLIELTQLIISQDLLYLFSEVTACSLYLLLVDFPIH